MKKASILLFILLFALFSCGNENPQDNNNTTDGAGLDNNLADQREDKPEEPEEPSEATQPPAAPPSSPAPQTTPTPAPPPPSPTVSFTAFGDWGEESYQTIPVANALKAYCLAAPCDFNVDTGDTFHAGPPASTTDPRWKSEYQDIFGVLGIPFYAAIGNHDADGDIQVLIDYAGISQTWHMPAEYYSLAQPANTPLVEFFFLNSGDFKFETAEKTWLANALSKSTAKWKVLVTHVPVISNGFEHGDDDGGFNYKLIPAICNKFDMILSGHEHIFSHLSEELDGCYFNQFLFGTGGAGHYGFSATDPRVHSTGAIEGFGWFQIKDNTLTFKMITASGKVFYQTSWTK